MSIFENTNRWYTLILTFPIFSLSLPQTTLCPCNVYGSVVDRKPPRNIRVFNPTTNTLNVRWEAATGPVQQYRVVYAPLVGNRPSESVSFYYLFSKHIYHMSLISTYIIYYISTYIICYPCNTLEQYF